MTQKTVSKISIIFLLQYILVVIFLMTTYQGGYIRHPEIHHFVFDKTYLSDLGRTHYFSGVYNPYWWVYSLTLGLVAIGTFMFYYILTSKMNKIRAFIVLSFALISAIGYLGIAFNPVDIRFYPHIIFGKIAFFSFFFALIFSLIFLAKNTKKSIVYLLVFLSILFVGFLYLQIMGLPRMQAEKALQIKVIAQKSIVIAQLVVAIAIVNIIQKTQ